MPFFIQMEIGLYGHNLRAGDPALETTGHLVDCGLCLGSLHAIAGAEIGRHDVTQLDALEPNSPKLPGVSVHIQRAADARRPCSQITHHRLAQGLQGHHVRHRQVAAGAKHAKRLAEDRVLVRREVDHAVGDDHVDLGVGQWNGLDLAVHESHVGRAQRLLVALGQLEHSRGHVQADHTAGRSYLARGQEAVDAAA